MFGLKSPVNSCEHTGSYYPATFIAQGNYPALEGETVTDVAVLANLTGVLLNRKNRAHNRQGVSYRAMLV
jgi:hypothetical protein